MRFEVQVGSPFECHAAEDGGGGGVIVQVTHSVGAPQQVQSSKQPSRWITSFGLAVLAFVSSTTFAATAYGYATGDYGPLKSLAECGVSIVQWGAKLATK